MNGYKAFFRGKQTEVHAETTIGAQDAAAKHFKARKPWEIAVVLCEKGGEQVTHSTATL